MNPATWQETDPDSLFGIEEIAAPPAPERRAPTGCAACGACHLARLVLLRRTMDDRRQTTDDGRWLKADR